MKRKLSQMLIGLTLGRVTKRGAGTVAEHSTHNPKIMGLNLVADTERDKMRKITLSITTLSITAFSIMTLSIMSLFVTLSINALSIATFSIMTLTITTFSIMTLSIMSLFVTLSINDTQQK